jgi:hypothetical protein
MEGIMENTPANDESNVNTQEDSAFSSIRLCTCGRVFTPYRKTQRFCSDACRVKYTKGKKSYYQKKQFVEKECKQCGKKFTTNDGKKKYCTYECLVKHEEDRHIKKEERTCLVCGTIFHSAHWSKRYCSDTCRAKARSER